MLNAKQEKALRALVSEPTKEKASKKAGITIKTLYSYLKDPEFNTRLSKVYDEMLIDTARMTLKNMEKAINTQRKLLDSSKEEIQLRASDSIISNGLKLYDVTDILKRLEKLEGMNHD